MMTFIFASIARHLAIAAPRPAEPAVTRATLVASIVNGVGEG